MDFIIETTTAFLEKEQDLIEKIQHTKGIGLKDLRFQDLLIYPGIGIYVFKKDDEIVYVGKATSWTFIERIAMHFAVDCKCWHNNVMKKVSECEKNSAKEYPTKDISEKVDGFLANHKLLIVNVKDDITEKKELEKVRESIGRFEACLINKFHPHYNRRSIARIP